MGNASKLLFKDFNSLEEFVDEVSEVLNCPITIEDTNHYLLAYSKHNDKTDLARITTIMSRRVPENVIDILWKKNIIPNLLTSAEPIIIEEIEEVGLGNRIAISIRHQEEILGFIWVLDHEQKVDEKGLEILIQASAIAKNLLLNRQAKNNKLLKDKQEIYRMLLNGVIKDNQKIIKQFERLELTPPAAFSIIIFRFNTLIKDKLFKQIIYTIETNKVPNISFHHIEENDLIILFDVKETKDFTKLEIFIDHLKKELNDRFIINNINWGFSTIQTNLQYIHNCYNEARSVLELKQIFPDDLAKVFGYHQLGLFKYIKTIAPHFEKPESIAILENYDKKNNSELLLTLETYLNCHLNINKAAKQLHIHVNTINYRLKRMAEIANINFKNFNEIGELYVSFKVKKYSTFNNS